MSHEGVRYVIFTLMPQLILFYHRNVTINDLAVDLIINLVRLLLSDIFVVVVASKYGVCIIKVIGKKCIKFVVAFCKLILFLYPEPDLRHRILQQQGS